MNIENLMSGMAGALISIFSSIGIINWQERERLKEKRKKSARAILLFIAQLEDIRTQANVANNSTAIYQRDLNGIISVGETLIPIALEIDELSPINDFGFILKTLLNLRTYSTTPNSAGLYHFSEKEIDKRITSLKRAANAVLMDEISSQSHS